MDPLYVSHQASVRSSILPMATRSLGRTLMFGPRQGAAGLYRALLRLRRLQDHAPACGRHAVRPLLRLRLLPREEGERSEPRRRGTVLPVEGSGPIGERFRRASQSTDVQRLTYCMRGRQDLAKSYVSSLRVSSESETESSATPRRSFAAAGQQQETY